MKISRLIVDFRCLKLYDTLLCVFVNFYTCLKILCQNWTTLFKIPRYANSGSVYAWQKMRNKDYQEQQKASDGFNHLPLGASIRKEGNRRTFQLGCLQLEKMRYQIMSTLWRSPSLIYLFLEYGNPIIIQRKSLLSLAK